MFSKLLSNIAVHPSALNTFVFYSKRLRREQSIRRLGLVFIVLSLFVQIFAAMIPAEKSLAYSDNHIINGIQTKSDILQAYDRSGSDIQKIYSKFGVTRQDIVNLPSKPNATIKSTASNNYWSIGRNSLSGYSNIDKQYKSQEIAVKTDGPTVYMRPLHAWDTKTYSTYNAFQGRNSTTGKTFWILVDCGNYTQVGKTIKEEPPKKPIIEAKKSVVAPSTQLKPGDTFKFKIEYRNKVPDSLAENVTIEDLLDTKNFDITAPTNAKINAGGKLTYSVGNLKYTENSQSLTLTAKVKSAAAGGQKICNVASISSSNATTVTTGASTACVQIVVPAVKTTTPTTPTTKPTPPPEPEKSEPKKEEPKDEEKIPPSLSKDVKNVTKNLEGTNAINTTVNAGDILEYSLTTSNTQSKAVVGYTVKDYVGDLLDYANLDIGLLNAEGGSFDPATREISWKNQTLPAKSDLVKTFRITIKNPVPSTNSPSTVSTGFDCKISNQYGNELTLNVQCPVVKTIETLPNTGPGTTIAVSFTTTVVAGYFFARARLLAKESRLIRRFYQHAGQG